MNIDWPSSFRAFGAEPALRNFQSNERKWKYNDLSE